MRPLEDDGLPELYNEERPERISIPSDVRLVRVETTQEKQDFLRVNADSWGMGEMSIELAARTFFEPDSAAGPNVAAVLAYVNDEPASGAMALVSHGAVGGYWGATAPWARRRGLGDLCVREMFNAGFDLGAERALCQASGSGEGIWRRMGFQRLTKFMRYQGKPVVAKWE
jgi:ribosomal protein S18 acetylase RimI-like enzyme